MLADFKSEVDSIREKITSAQNILILTRNNPSYDGLASALALYLTLQKNGKKAAICSPNDLTVSYSDLVGVNKIKKEISGKNFVISLDYQEGAIEKVSYNIENNKFNLIIQPREGSNWQITPENIQFNYQPTDFNLIILLESISQEELNTFYPNEQELFSKTPIITIDKGVSNSQFATINLTSPDSASISEIIVHLLVELKLGLDKDVAANLLKGIYSATDNLQNIQITPETFEALALCLRSGAQISSSPTQAIDKASQETLSSLAKPKQVQPQEEKSGQPPDDWLKPKIFKGSTLL